MGELATANQEGLPVFRGSSFDEHVETWLSVDESMQNHLWMLGAIAASLVQKHGENRTGQFASRVKRSERTVRRFAQTYREWEKRSALTVLTFHHHTIAARDPEPQEVIAMAHDNEWSTRELEEVVKQRKSKKKGAAKYGKDKEEGDVSHEAVMICPHCDGAGVVPYRGRKQ